MQHGGTQAWLQVSAIPPISHLKMSSGYLVTSDEGGSNSFPACIRGGRRSGGDPRKDHPDVNLDLGEIRKHSC